MRLNSYLADCGVAARRKAEAVVLAGRVRVNGKIVLAPYFQVDPEQDTVTLDGKKLEFTPKVYLVMNKPQDVVCAVSNKYDPVVVDLLPEKYRRMRVFPAGRLDRDSEGLLILTNDGMFMQNVLHPSKGIAKEYEVLLNIEINDKQLARWRSGFEMEGRHVKPLSVGVMEREPKSRWVSVAIGEGLKREVRMMARMVGFGVLALIRRRIGNMTLDTLGTGEFVELSFSDLYSKIFEGGSV